MFRKSFEKDIAETKQTMLTINATEGGASIYGTLEIPFSEAIGRYVSTKEPKQRIEILRAAAHERERVAVQTWNKVETMRAYVSELCEESKALFLEIAQTIEHPKESYEMQTLQTLVGRAEAIKARYEEEIYEKVAWHIAQSTMLSKEIELAPAEVYMPKDATEEKERLWHLLEAYKPWLFLFAGIMDAVAKTIAYAKAKSDYEEVQQIDVYVGDTKIDTVACQTLSAQNGRVFDVDVRGILYDVPDAYQEQIERIVFKDAASGDILPEAFVSVFRRDDAKYNELSFMKSLEEPIDEKLKNMYKPNCVGFLATKENLEDEEFMDYMKELKKRYPLIQFNGLYIKSSLVYNKINDFKFINFVQITCFKDFVNNTEVFISNPAVRIYSNLDNLLLKCQNIYVSFYERTRKNENINKHDYNEDHILIRNYKLFGFNIDELKNMNFNGVKLGTYQIFKILGKELPNFEKFDVFEFYNFTIFKYIFNNSMLKTMIHNRNLIANNI
ncbi:MAG: hypothetical protein AB7E13_08250 [Arcobacteraceae bacterium]